MCGQNTGKNNDETNNTELVKDVFKDRNVWVLVISDLHFRDPM